MSIKQEITAWDGKSADDIRTIYLHYYEQTSFVADIIALIGDTTLQKGATWLLKYYLESGSRLKINEAKKVYGLLSQLENWETRLHVLQCIPYIPVTKTEKNKVEVFLRNCLCDTNKFVRAWSYNGFYELSSQYPEYKEETKQFFEMAMRDEVTSVKARIRNIEKKGF